MGARIALVVATLLTAGACGAASAEPSPPWVGISRGAGPIGVPSPGLAGAVLIGSRQRLARFPYLTAHPGHLGCCEWYETFDWKRRAVLLVVARLPREWKISRLARRRNVLRVALASRYPGQPDFGTPLTSWEAVSLPRSLLGRPLPRRIVVAVS
jgi:hypothetical protein